MAGLNDRQRHALEDAKSNDGLRRTHDPNTPSAAPWPAPHVWQTLNSLTNRGLLVKTTADNGEQRVDTWRITDAGREALDPPPKTRRVGHNSMRAKGAAVSLVYVNGVWQHQRFPEPEKVTDSENDSEDAELERKRERHDAEVQARRKDRKLLSAEARLVEVRRRAKQRQLNVSHEAHIAEKMIDRARRGGRPVPEAAVTKIERLEERLDYRPDLAA